MKISENGINLICSFEGFKSKPYLDIAGVATIGYGTTIYPDGFKVSISDGEVGEEKAKEFISFHVENLIEPILNTLNLNQNQFDSLCSFCYNVGIGAFKSSTLLARIKSKEGDIEEAFLMWNKSGGKEVDGLTKRRKLEAQLYLTLHI